MCVMRVGRSQRAGDKGEKEQCGCHWTEGGGGRWDGRQVGSNDSLYNVY